jgi:hypothetical protein
MKKKFCDRWMMDENDEEQPRLPPSPAEWKAAKKRIADLETQVKAKEQECERLGAELERRKLPRGNGKVPVNGEYWVRMRQGWTIQQTSTKWLNLDGMEWAGPIEPPEES